MKAACLRGWRALGWRLLRLAHRADYRWFLPAIARLPLPLAYALSALAGVVYIAATLGLAEIGPAPRRLAWAAVSFELVGVLTVGTLTVLDPELFPDQTVWSSFGAGYGWLPLVLPFLGLAWLVRTRPEPG